MTEFLLPELGENVAGGDVLRVLVKTGDTINHDQPILELETDKATIEVPSSVSGRVADVRVKEGQRIKVGDVVLAVEGTEAAAAAPAASTPPAEAGSAPVEAPDATGQADPGWDDEAELAAGDAQAGVETEASEPSGPVEFTLPSLGENVAGGDVLRVLVAPGDEIKNDQPLLELETDKATIEVPSSIAGRVLDVRVKEGERVQVGQVVLVVEGTSRAAARPSPLTVQRVHAAAAPAQGQSPDPEQSLTAEDVAPIGGLQQRVPGQIRPSIEDKPGMLEIALEEARAEAVHRAGGRGAVVPMPPREESAARRPAAAAPSVRRVARELGVDIHQVTGTGPGGRISADDVKAYVKRLLSSGGPRLAQASSVGVPAIPLPDFAKWGPVDRQPMRSVRRKTAEHVSQAWAAIPHVTQCDKVDITHIDALRERYASRAESAGGKLTVTAIVLKVLGAALKQFPQFNSSIDMAAQEIVLKKYVHVGIAVDTERGLLVPVIRDVDRKNIVELSVELAQAAERARAGKTTLDEMQGGCFTITNLGGIGGTYFTPIVNQPEVAILGLSRAQMEPVWRDDKFEPRLRLPLSLSYDHRVIDGADGIRFLRWITEALEQPFLLSLLG